MWKTVLVAFVLIGLVSCSDDTQAPPQSDKPAVTADKGTTGDKGATEARSGACTNAADGALMDTEAKRDGIEAKAKTCGLGCLTAADKQKCANDCVVKETGLSAGCSGCYAGIILCSMTNCAVPCAADPNSEACKKCNMGDNPAKANCYQQFYSCSGLPPEA